MTKHDLKKLVLIPLTIFFACIAMDGESQAFGLSCDLGVWLTANANQVPVGTPVSYTIRVVNNPGNIPAAAGTATNVRAVLSLPASNVTFISADAGCYPTNNTVICQFDNMLSGASSSRVVTVTPTQAGSLQAQVTVSANETDINMYNNQASVAMTVTGAR